MDARVDPTSNHRRERTSGVALRAALAILLVILVAGCSSSSNQSNQSSNKNNKPNKGGSAKGGQTMGSSTGTTMKATTAPGTTAGTTAGATMGSSTGMQGQTMETTGGGSGGGGDVGKSGNSGKPYAAIPPPPGAKPLKEKASAAEAKNMPAFEAQAYGDPPGVKSSRSVPLGQTLMAGENDLSNGPLKGNRLVAYYGTPLSSQMGVLGEYGKQEMMQKLKAQTRAYSAADPAHPAIPTIEFIASTAQRDPGADGLYIGRTSPKVIEEYAKLAEQNHALLMLDVQLGRDSVMDEVKALEPFLKRPYVHLAIDTEYHVGPGQVPGVDLGHVDGSEIEPAIKYLNNLVKQNNLPDKILLVHQFQSGIVTNKQLIRPTNNIQVVLNADGFGKTVDKYAKYRILVRDEPLQYGGFKLFYTQDTPLLSPEQVVKLDPAPAVIEYQ